MNNLSWLLYFAGMFGALKAVAFAVCLFSVLLGLPVLGAMTEGGHIENPRPWLKRIAIIVAAGALVLIVTPSKNTMYAIAASEMGEQALQSPIATKASKALEKWLDDQIADEK